MFDVEFAENEVITLLCDPRLEGIAFELGGVTIARGDFRRVGQAIRGHRIRVAIGTAEDVASYHPSDNSFVVPWATGSYTRVRNVRNVEGLIIHEAVHALRDIEHTGRPIAATLDEAVAYVAQQYWYYLNDDAAPTVRSHEGTPDWIIESVLADARAIAETLGSRSPVTTASLDALRSRISALTFWDPTRGRFICPYSATEERTYDGV